MFVYIVTKVAIHEGLASYFPLECFKSLEGAEKYIEKMTYTYDKSIVSFEVIKHKVLDWGKDKKFLENNSLSETNIQIINLKEVNND